MKIYHIFLITALMLGSCSKVRESAGVNRKSIDEFKVIENPPLVIPPEFNLTSPDQLNNNKIQNLDNDLVNEILFGLDKQSIQNELENSTMNKILSELESPEDSKSIREEIDKEFFQQIETNNIFDFVWEDEKEILDAIKESERIRSKNFDGESLSKYEVPVKKIIIKKKKKKRFIIF